MAQSLKNEPLISLSTEVQEARQVEVDGEKYDVLGQGHIGRAEEVKLMTLFKRHERAQRDFDSATDERKIATAAEKMRDARLEIITTFTEFPEDVADRLALHAQANLLDIIAKEMGFTADDEPGL